MEELHEKLALPGVEAQPVNVEEYAAYTPEKFELLEGYLFHPLEYPEARHRLLRLLPVNVGLVEAVRLVPEARWREALKRVYG